MLCEADAKLVQRDSPLPGLGTLLDGDAFADLLRRLHPETDIEWAHPNYVRYKAGTSCLVGYVVRAGGAEINVYARSHRQDRSIKLDKASQQQNVPGLLGDGIEVVPDLAIAVYVFPNDHEVRALRRLLDPRRGWRTLKRLQRADKSLWKGSLRTIRYKPERRCVAQLILDDKPRAVTKLYTDSAFDLARSNARAFADQPHLQTAPLLGVAARYCALTWQWIEGPGLMQLLKESSTPQDSLDRVGDALGKLHRQQLSLQTTLATKDYAAALQNAVRAIEEFYPELGPRAEKLYQRLAKLLTEHQWRSQAIHGDFSADQVILANEDAVILDLDRAGWGDPCIDLGTFGANLLFAALTGQLSNDRARTAMDGLIGAYCKSTGTNETRGTELFTAGQLLQLAQEPFRHRFSDWPAMTESLLDCAEKAAPVETLVDRTTR